MARKNDWPVDVELVFEKFRHGVRAHIAEDDVSTHLDLGLAYSEMGLFDDAEAEFALVLKADPSNARALEALVRIRQERHWT